MFLAPVTTDLGQNGEVEEFVSSMCLSDFLESYAEIMGMSLLIFLMFIHFFEEKNILHTQSFHFCATCRGFLQNSQ